jgi:cyclic pyranopterin phosphate synthase
MSETKVLQDDFGRRITYMRVSVTDRCNLRCVYCMPPQGVLKKPHREMMRYEEIARVVAVAAEHGVREVRLTGGEPLVRPDLPMLVRMIAQIPGIVDLSLTTNGVLLEGMAAELAGAGLQRVNVSLDTLDEDKYRRITRGGQLERVWRGIKAAEVSGLAPVKINVVAMRGVNDDELPDLARLSISHPWHVRFIELMPVNNHLLWGPDFPQPKEMYISVSEIMDRLSALGLKAVEKSIGSGPASLYQAEGGLGKIGFISAMSEHFCGQCNRLRLTADGRLRSCLLNDTEVSLLESLRAGEDILPYLQKAVKLKPLRHPLSGQVRPSNRYMQEIGG